MTRPRRRPTHRRTAVLPVTLLALAAAGLSAVPAGAAAAPLAAPGGDVIKDRYIVVFEQNTPKKDRDAARDNAKSGGGQVHFEYGTAVKGFAATLPAKAVEALRRNKHVISVEPDTTVRVTATQVPTPSWGLDRIDQAALPLDRSFTYDATGSGVTAYVIDSGVRATHTDFGGRVGAGYTAIADGRGTNDCNGHGTHVAGTVGGTTYGVAKAVRIVPVRVLDCNGEGTMSGVVAGVDWVAARGGTGAVANMSLGGPVTTALDSAVSRAITNGTTFVVAAGNENADACATSPARVPAAITVGASTPGDARAEFSNFGSCVDIFAPGEDITSPVQTSTTAVDTFSGTSMAAPHVAGVVAAHLQSARPGPAAVTSALLNSATTGALSSLGSGSPNRLLRTITPAGAPAPAPAPTPANSPPVATSPAASLPAFGSRINTTSVPVTLSWSALDSDGDAIASYTLQQSTDGGSTWSTVALPSATATSVTLNLGTVSNRAYRVRATDARGLAGVYAAAPAFAQTLTQESAAAYAPASAWSSSSVSGAYGGYVRRSQTANATATYTFTGSQIAWLATGSSNRGRAEIVLDGVSQGVVDLYSGTLLSRVVAFSKAVPAGTHTLQIKALGTRDPRASAAYVDVDGFVVLR